MAVTLEQGSEGPLRALIKEIGRVGCVSCACAKAEGERPLCVGASYIGVTHVCILLYQCGMRSMAVIRICNVVATPDCSRPKCNLNLYDINGTICKVGEAPFALLLPLGFIVGSQPHGVSQPKKNHSARHVRIVGSI
jgi:hypothetical protein